MTTIHDDGKSAPTATRMIDEFVRSHLLLRRFVGVVGICLPTVLVVVGFVGGRISGAVPPTVGLWDSLQSSISAYYYTSAGNVFVGSMVAFGAFLVTYRYGRAENVVGNVGGACAVVVGVCPTTPALPTAVQRVVGGVHLVAAVSFFVCMAIFCLALFPRDPDRAVERNTVPTMRQRLFRVCGSVVVLCIVWGLVDFVLPDRPAPEAWSFLLWPESLAVMAFAVAWLVKGKQLTAAETAAVDAGGAGPSPRHLSPRRGPEER